MSGPSVGDVVEASDGRRQGGRPGRRWSVGELARATGVSVRSLHHYDRIGLLTAEQRTASGHRRYTERDLRRLYRIRALRGLGLGLSQIAAVLAGQGDDLAGLRDLLAAQLRGLDEQAARMAELRGRIGGLLAQLDARQVPDPDLLLATLELITVYETYFTQDQRDALAARRAELGPEAVADARREWTELVSELLPHVAANTPPDNPRVADLAARWDAIGTRFQPVTAGAGTAAAARRMWQENSAELAAALPWSADQLTALVGYLDRVRAARTA